MVTFFAISLNTSPTPPPSPHGRLTINPRSPHPEALLASPQQKPGEGWRGGRGRAPQSTEPR
ncbi:hypothetical protein, partial [Chondromyces apiculatus]|uniref:hypothetical protein n=1 Tax=Chondromyces apiculatus TaxID=51 RepID=UPI001E5A45F0